MKVLIAAAFAASFACGGSSVVSVPSQDAGAQVEPDGGQQGDAGGADAAVAGGNLWPDDGGVIEVAADSGSNAYASRVVPATAGDSFYLSATSRVVSGDGWSGIGLFFLDIKGGVISAEGTIGPRGPTDWLDISYQSGPAPVGTVSARLSLESQFSTRLTVCDFQGVYARIR